MNLLLYTDHRMVGARERGEDCHARRATVSRKAWAPVDEPHTSRRASRRRCPHTRVALA